METRVFQDIVNEISKNRDYNISSRNFHSFRLPRVHDSS